MHTSPYVVPVYQHMTIVSTALSRDTNGDMVHAITCSTTIEEPIEVVFELQSERK